MLWLLREDLTKIQKRPTCLACLAFQLQDAHADPDTDVSEGYLKPLDRTLFILASPSNPLLLSMGKRCARGIDMLDAHAVFLGLKELAQSVWNSFPAVFASLVRWAIFWDLQVVWMIVSTPSVLVRVPGWLCRRASPGVVTEPPQEDCINSHQWAVNSN